MNAMNTLYDNNSTVLVSNERVNVCTFGKISGCANVISRISSARDVALRAKFRLLNEARAHNNISDMRNEVANILNFLQNDLMMSADDIKCVFNYYTV